MKPLQSDVDTRKKILNNIKAPQKQLAELLGVRESTISQYPFHKKNLMVIGLGLVNLIERNPAVEKCLQQAIEHKDTGENKHE